MTTIATDGKSIACDSYLTGSECTIGHVEKIFPTKVGFIGVAGTYTSCVDFVYWLLNEDPDADEPDMTEVSAIHLTKNGVYVYDSSVTPYKVIGPFNAIGNGAQGALTAMHLGHTPEDAVSAVSKVDPYTGGRISVYFLPLAE